VGWKIYELIEEGDFKLLEKRGCDPGKKRFQISASTLEHKPAKARECNMCHA